MRTYNCSECGEAIASSVPGVAFIPPFAVYGYQVGRDGRMSASEEAPAFFCNIRCLRRWLA